ncbi:MAG: class I SAM-dependent methyltransferase [Pirellulaceae bacterium]|jgi:SAM-dependent methyltransferase|nr:class I SAM-dependent methyltransferase [Pirellulaceae bacterium]MDP7305367.1 class I SAM-dependent methyltransferase [Pirellulaceae bacterium]HJN11783.1 class I SAM-dependent methyltransferase [Pirellulaceae bacterium]
MNETIQGHLYDFPRYYDLVFGSDWRAELDFLQVCFEKHAGRRVRTVFEPACGTGRLMFRLAKAGYDVSGLDLNERAVDYCNKRLVRHGFRPTAFVANMSEFQLPRRVDAAFNMINSFRHLLDRESARAHLHCIADCLSPGGLYLLGLHLTPTTTDPIDEESWSAQRGSLCVNSRLWSTARDLEAREEHCRMTFDVYTPTRGFRIEDTVIFRTYTHRQLLDLVQKIEGLEMVATYDFAYDVESPLKIDDSTEDIVFVLRKK